MRPRDELADLEDPVEIAATWGDLFFSGRIEAMDWLTMRTGTVDLSGTASRADPMAPEEAYTYSAALREAFGTLAWRVGRVEQREHEVRLDASLEARHTGPLDLSAFGGPTYPASGRTLRLPLQRLCWTIAHKRVLGFEVERGPGLGPRFLARELELGPDVAARKEPAEGEPATNGHEGDPRARSPTPGQARAEAGRDEPGIEELIEPAEAQNGARSSETASDDANVH